MPNTTAIDVTRYVDGTRATIEIINHGTAPAGMIVSGEFALERGHWYLLTNSSHFDGTTPDDMRGWSFSWSLNDGCNYNDILFYVIRANHAPLPAAVETMVDARPAPRTANYSNLTIDGSALAINSDATGVLNVQLSDSRPIAKLVQNLLGAAGFQTRSNSGQDVTRNIRGLSERPVVRLNMARKIAALARTPVGECYNVGAWLLEYTNINKNLVPKTGTTIPSVNSVEAKLKTTDLKLLGINVYGAAVNTGYRESAKALINRGLVQMNLSCFTPAVRTSEHDPVIALMVDNSNVIMCACCGDYIRTGYYALHRGQDRGGSGYVCLECACSDQHHCCNCNTAIPAQHGVEVEALTSCNTSAIADRALSEQMRNTTRALCPSCRESLAQESRLGYCDACGRGYITGADYCGACATAISLRARIKRAQESIRKVWTLQGYSTKPPLDHMRTTSDSGKCRLYGLELELELDRSEYDNDVYRDFYETVKDLIRDVAPFGQACPKTDAGLPLLVLKSDGSLDYGVEICTSPCSLNFHRDEFKWTELLSYFSEGFVALDTCGIHIHTGRKQLEPTLQNKIGFIIMQMARSLEPLQGRGSQSYCTVKTKKMNKHLKDMCESRYEAVNYTNANTIEYRACASTIDYNTVLARLELFDSLISFAEHTSAATLVKPELFKRYKDHVKQSRKSWPYLVQEMRTFGIMTRTVKKTNKGRK